MKLLSGIFEIGLLLLCGTSMTMFRFTIGARIFFTAVAIFFGIIVLMGHLHYSIDVLSAFFITYSIYHIAKFLFKEDKILFDKEVTSGLNASP